MGSNKTKSQQFTSTNQTSGPPQWVQNQGQDIYNQAQQLVNSRPDYTPYTGEAVAPLSQNWNTANSTLQGMLASGNPDLGQTRDILGQLRGTVDPTRSLASYMSDYTDAALAPTLRKINEQGALNQNSINAQATGAGAFGDAGHGLLQAQNMRDTNQLVGDTTAKAYDTAFNQATTARNADLARLLGISGADQSLGQAQYGQDTGLASMLNQLGSQQQQNQQAQDTFNYNQFQQGQQFPYQNLQWLQSILKGTPVETTSTGNSATFGQSSQPNSAASGIGGQLLGSLLGGLGSLGGAIPGTLSAGGALGDAGGGLLGGLGSLFALSDRRLKTDIDKVGELGGHNIYAYRYKGDPARRLGVMAQEVLLKNPDAVADEGGVLKVDYLKLLREGVDA